jgi:ribonuclease HI
VATISGVYTDGACSGNPGPGGWGVVVFFNDRSVEELGGRSAATTNNRMEIQAAIAALNYFIDRQRNDACEIHTDSEYLIKGITQWLRGWKQKGWKTATGKPVLNQDLWEELDKASTQVKLQTGQAVRWQHVRGHSGNPGNERCDEIARGFAANRPPVLRSRPSEPVTTVPTKELATTPHAIDPLDTINTTINSTATMSEDTANHHTAEHHEGDRLSSDGIPREIRVQHLQYTIETLRIADEVARSGYCITSAELADLMDVNASAVTSRGDRWRWRNWIVSRIRREGNQILWQLERVEETD